MTPPNRDLLLGLALAVCVVVAVAPFASRDPDTLEKTVEKLHPGNLEVQTHPAPMQDYQVRWLSSRTLSTTVAGLAGILAVVLLLRLLVRPRRAAPPRGDSP